MKVSIIVLSYNHALYIGETLQSLIDQNVEFEYEILVGDDCSSDNSRTIISQYYERFPEKIRKIFPETNLGPNANYLNCFKSTKGKYIAFCEGDDYWIDDNKLQKQVDFLEQNSQYGGVSTNSRWFFQNGNTFKDIVLDEGEIRFEDLCKSNNINSQTNMYNKELIKDLDWMKHLKIGDWALHLLITSQKPHYRLPDITSVYRVHNQGMYSLINEDIKLRQRVEVLIAASRNLELSQDRKTLLKSSIADLFKRLLNFNSQDIKLIRKNYLQYSGTYFNKTMIKSYINQLF